MSLLGAICAPKECLEVPTMTLLRLLETRVAACTAKNAPGAPPLRITSINKNVSTVESTFHFGVSPKASAPNNLQVDACLRRYIGHLTVDQAHANLVACWCPPLVRSHRPVRMACASGELGQVGRRRPATRHGIARARLHSKGHQPNGTSNKGMS